MTSFDLETFLEALQHRGWGPEELCRYIDARIRLHDRVFTTDELEVAGVFVHDGNLDALAEAQGDLVVLGPDSSAIFDEIFTEKMGGPKVNFSRGSRLEFHDVRGLIEAASIPAPGTHAATAHKVGRNQPCPCGSGRKFKKCCLGRNRR